MSSYAYRHCGCKVVYYTRTQARKAIKEKRLKFGNRLYSYRCEFCGWWHLSTADHKRKKYVVEGQAFWR